MNTIKAIVWACIAVIAFFGVLQVVTDEPQMPNVIFSNTNLSCPIKNGC